GSRPRWVPPHEQCRLDVCIVDYRVCLHEQRTAQQRYQVRTSRPRTHEVHNSTRVRDVRLNVRELILGVRAQPSLELVVGQRHTVVVEFGTGGAHDVLPSPMSALPIFESVAPTFALRLFESIASPLAIPPP